MLLRSWVEAAGLADRVAWVAVEPRRAGRAAVLARGDRRARRASAASSSSGSARPRVPRRGRGRAAARRTRLARGAARAGDRRSARAAARPRRWRGWSCCSPGVPAQLQVVLATPRGAAARPASAAPGRRADRDPGGGPALLAGRDARAARGSGIALSDEAVALLHERTEGWAAGLRLAAISLAGHPDPERFVAEFSGSERTVAEYLLAEVLERQPPEVRELLLRTSILDRVSGPLADCLTGGSGSERILQELEDANAFVISLDAGADVVSLPPPVRGSPAARAAPHRPRQHRRSCTGGRRWYEEHGHLVDAIRHAQAAGTGRRGAPARRQLRQPDPRRPTATVRRAAGRISCATPGR